MGIIRGVSRGYEVDFLSQKSFQTSPSGLLNVASPAAPRKVP